VVRDVGGHAHFDRSSSSEVYQPQVGFDDDLRIESRSELAGAQHEFGRIDVTPPQKRLEHAALE
jgi:hypothetical protein